MTEKQTSWWYTTAAYDNPDSNGLSFQPGECLRVLIGGDQEDWWFAERISSPLANPDDLVVDVTTGMSQGWVPRSYLTPGDPPESLLSQTKIINSATDPMFQTRKVPETSVLSKTGGSGQRAAPPSRRPPMRSPPSRTPPSAKVAPSPSSVPSHSATTAASSSQPLKKNILPKADAPVRAPVKPPPPNVKRSGIKLASTVREKTMEKVQIPPKGSALQRPKRVPIANGESSEAAAAISLTDPAHPQVFISTDAANTSNNPKPPEILASN
eukprot:UC4_evm5s351